MCVIVKKPKGIILDREIYEECFASNDDGAGLAYVTDEGVLKVEKGFFKADEIIKLIDTLGDRDMVIHFRIQTHGLVNEENCHPYLVKCKGALKHYSFAIAHNGQLAWRSSATESDTNCFIYDILGPALERDPWWLDSTVGKLILKTLIGEKNKMVIMRHNSKADKPEDTIKIYTINDQAGIYDMGCWFSNGSYLPWKGAKFGTQDIRRNAMFCDAYRKHGRSNQTLTEIGMIQDPDFKDTWVSKNSIRGREILNPKEVKNILTGLPLGVSQGPIKPQERQLAGSITSAGSTSREEVNKGMTMLDEEEKARYKDAETLPHLNSSEKTHIRQMAYEFFQAHFKTVDFKATNAEMVMFMRDEVRMVMELDKDWTDNQVDQYIMLEDMKGTNLIFAAIFHQEVDFIEG